MIRAAIYCRFSTDKQSEASLADQERICRIRAGAQSWEVVAVHGDDGVSGSTPVDQRPGGRALLADALAGRFDVLLLEGLDRLSRDLVESERVVRRLEHRKIRIVGVADGYDSTGAAAKVVRGVRGLVNDLYLDDLRHKTHRGLAGKVSRGLHAGGLSFGYRSIEVDGGHRLEIDPERARWVVWIFEQYAQAGVSARNIAHELNRLGVASPRGGTWAVSALYGSPAKGSGVLNNELYVGRMIWNRSQWVKDPDTGRRVRLDRPASEWQTVDAPELRIVGDELWQAARARRDAPRLHGGRGKGAAPRTMFGGLMRCGRCGGPVVAVDARRYGCSAANDRGPAVCRGVDVPRQDADARLLSLVRDELASPAALVELQREVTAVAARRRREGADARRAAERRAAELDAEIGRLVGAIASMGGSPALQARLQTAEAERATLGTAGGAPARQEAGIVAGEALARYRKMLMDLQGALDRDRQRARRLMAELLGPITLTEEGEEVWATLEAKEPARLLVAGSLLGVVAGARNGTRRRLRLR